MLQQTPVSRVLPAYAAWLARWPTPAALATDPPGEAVRMWGRLGYPRRALRLHECAVAIAGRHGGRVPADVDALLALPGVGAYTARAVAAFAFGRRCPVVDTNVRRVVTRAVDGVGDAGVDDEAIRLDRGGCRFATVGELRAKMLHAGTAGFAAGSAVWVSDPAGPDPDSPFTGLCRRIHDEGP